MNHFFFTYYIDIDHWLTFNEYNLRTEKKYLIHQKLFASYALEVLMDRKRCTC